MGVCRQLRQLQVGKVCREKRAVKKHGIVWYCKEMSRNSEEPGEFGSEK